MSAQPEKQRQPRTEWTRGGGGEPEPGRLLAAVIDALPGAAYVLAADASRTPLAVSEGFAALTGYQPRQWLDDPLFLLRHAHPDDRALLLEVPGEALDRTFRLVAEDGRVVGLYEQARLASGGAGQPQLWYGVLLASSAALSDALGSSVLYDPLTGLPTGPLLLDRLRHGLTRLQRRLGSVALLLVDVEQEILTQAVLATVVERLRGCVRPGDTLGRDGNGRFVLVLEDVAAVEEAEDVAERVLGVLAAALPLAGGGGELRLAARAGIAIGTAPEALAEHLLRDAMTACDQAKPGRHTVFDPAIYARSLSALARERDLRHALAHDDLLVTYQPLVDLTDQRIVAVTAAPYWEHPEQGLLDAAAFRELAQASGLDLTIGRALLDESCAQLGEWQSVYPTEPPLRLSVALSAYHLRQPDLALDVERALGQGHLAATSLILEIDESVVAGAADRDLEALRALRGQGVRLALGAFGSGVAALTVLRRLPLDLLKLAPEAAAASGTKPEDDASRRALVAVGHALGLPVVATDVETADDVARARSLGCDLAEGRALAPPNLPDAFARLLRLTGGRLPEIAG
ncbi:MAG TPA: EAL domain-containing protein [Nitrolancea sp.]|nr:EAL domain-containing protein [Nitrolancea sp.]